MDFSLQIYYETTCDVNAGEELLLGPKEPIRLDGSGEKGENDSAILASMMGAGGQHSGGNSNGSGVDSAEEGEVILKPTPGGSGKDDIAVDSMDEDGHVSDNDEEDGVKCIKCEKIFPDIFK